MKPSKFANMPPRMTKGTLTTLAKKQVAADEAKALELLAKGEGGLPGMPVGTVVEIGKEDVAAVHATIAAVVAGDQQAAAEAIVANITPPSPEEGPANAPVGVGATTPQEADLPPPKPPKGTTDGLYALGKRYSPKTDRNSETWGKICKALADGPKTMKELAEAVKGHGDFLGYMTRGGHIIPHKVEEKVSG